MMLKSFDSKIGDILKNVRQINGLTQEEVAEAFNKSNSWVSRIENGEREIRIKSLMDLCKLYDADMLDVLKEALYEE